MDFFFVHLVIERIQTMKYFIVFLSILFLATAANAQQQQVDTIPAQQGWVHLTSGTTAYLPLLCLKGKDTVYAEGGIITLRSTDAGATWDSATNLPGPGYLNIGDDGTEYFSGPADTLFVSMDEGSHWQPHYTGFPFAGAEIKTKGTYCWLRYGSNIAYSFDRGITWGGGQTVGLIVRTETMSFDDTLNGFVAGDNQAWYHGRPDAPLFARTTNSGIDWDTVYPGPTNGHSGIGSKDIYGLAATSKNTLFAVGLCIARSTDGGDSWDTIPYNDDGYNGLGAITFPDSLHGTTVGTNGWIFHTSDGGNSWQKQTSPYAGSLGDVKFVDSLVGYASGPQGTIIKTSNGGLSWVNISPNISDLVHAISYPEPCNTSTKLSFSLPEPQHIWLSFFDMNGRKVGEYLSGLLQNLGMQTITIDTSQYLSGQYTYDLVTDKYYGSGKITVLH
jgi:hypothetical protein